MLDQAQLLRKYIQEKSRGIEGAGAEKPRSVNIISVTSGKGGVGKSNFTVNFALELCRQGHRVLIIDADFGLSNVDVILGITPKYDLSYVIRREKRLRDVVCEGPFGVKFISGGSGVYELISLGSVDIDYVLEELSTLEDMADTVIFDTGAGINENNIQLISSSDEVVLVTTPEPPAIVDAYALAKTLHSANSNADIRLVINRAESQAEAKRISENFVNVAANYLKVNIDELGYITDDSAVVKSVKSQKPFIIGFPGSEAAKNVVNIVNRYLEKPVAETGGIKAFIRRMLKR